MYSTGKPRWFLTVCLLLTAASLLGHFAVEGLCVPSPENNVCLDVSDGPAPFTLSSLHTGFVTPELPLANLVLTLTFAFISLHLVFNTYSPSPLFHPPIPLFH